MQEQDFQDQNRSAVDAIMTEYGGTSMGTLRRVYDDDFAPGFGDDSQLARIILLLDEPSLRLLVEDHAQKRLADKIAAA